MGRRRFADNGLCRKIKRNAQYVRIFDIEQSFFIQIVGLPAKRTANDLFAQQLRTERADTEDMRYGIGVPAFGEHGNRHDAADAFTKLSLLADRIHDFAQDGCFRQLAATQ